MCVLAHLDRFFTFTSVFGGGGRLYAKPISHVKLSFKRRVRVKPIRLDEIHRLDRDKEIWLNLPSYVIGDTDVRIHFDTFSSSSLYIRWYFTLASDIQSQTRRGTIIEPSLYKNANNNPKPDHLTTKTIIGQPGTKRIIQSTRKISRKISC